jgi:Kindlin-2 N-terminal domain
MIHVGDNTWNIRIMITDLQVEKTLRVKGDLHIGGVMLKLSKTEGEFSSYQRRPKSEFPLVCFVISADIKNNVP